MDVETHAPTSVVVPQPLPADLVAALEQATLMAKQQLPTTTDPSHLLQTLHSAHHQLSLYLSNHHHHPPPPPPENSFSSAMELGDDDNDNGGAEQHNSVDKVEERMRDCFIRNKRPKRQLSPSAAAVEPRWNYENGGGVAVELDSIGNKLRSLDLIYQFHA